MFNYCFIQTASAYSFDINVLCGSGTTTEDPINAACDVTILSVSSTCLNIIVTADPSLCSICQSELAPVVSACRDAVSLQ